MFYFKKVTTDVFLNALQFKKLDQTQDTRTIDKLTFGGRASILWEEKLSETVSHSFMIWARLREIVTVIGNLKNISGQSS